jgi:hypothetical protein
MKVYVVEVYCPNQFSLYEMAKYKIFRDKRKAEEHAKQYDGYSFYITEIKEKEIEE